MATPAVGCRVRILKNYATVRYIGPVSEQHGTWVGVEWDDASRGKHDGSTAGVRYFTCSSGTTSGSFVRIERVCFGTSVLEALRARYNNETAEYGEDVRTEELYVHTSRRHRVQVLLVGEDKIQQKQRQTHLLHSARLVGLDVSAVGDPVQLRGCLPSLISLDLTANLVADWAFAEKLAGGTRLVKSGVTERTEEDVAPGALPQLEVLNLSENRLTISPAPPGLPGGPRVLLPGLRVLVLNDCGLRWRDALTVAPALPSLEELHLCGNPIGHLHGPTPPPQHQPIALEAHPPDTVRQHQAEIQKQKQEQQEQAPLHETGTCTVACELSAAAAATAAAKAGSDEEVSGGAACGGGDDSDEAAAKLLAELFPRLQVLTLEDSQLSGWTTLQLLHRLPALARLHLAGNTNITHIMYPCPGPCIGPSARPRSTSADAVDSTAVQSPVDSHATPGLKAVVGSAAAAPDAAPAPHLESSPSDSVPVPALVSASSVVDVARAASPSFPALVSLFLGGCGLAEWESVNQLARFPELKEVRLTGNPVLARSKAGGRFEVIGRLSRLRQLNGAEVRSRERRDAELRYLQHIAAEMEAAGADESRRAAVRAAHPRVRELMELHGAVLATAGGGTAGGRSLGANTVDLKLTCVAAGSTAKMGTQVKKLPKSTTIGALRLLCERLFKVKSDQMALFLRAPNDPLPEDIGAEDLQDRNLGFFGVQDGYEVLVDEADQQALKRADEDSRAAAAGAHRQRLAEQLRTADKMQAEFVRSMGLQQQQ